MISGVESVSAMSFTRNADGVAQSGSSMSREMQPLTDLQSGQGAETAGQAFDVTLASVAQDMVGTLRNAEAASFAGVTGQANTREVVDAVMAAEQTLQTAIAIRDKIVQAYLEISRLQI